MPSTQTKPSKDSVIIFCCKDIVSSRPPDLHPDLVIFRQLDHTADTRHLATFIWQIGVIQRHYFLSVLDNSTLSTSVHRCMHVEVIEPIQRAGEEACAWTIGSSLIDQHSGKLQCSRMAGVAVVDIQLGCEGYSG